MLRIFSLFVILSFFGSTPPSYSRDIVLTPPKSGTHWLLYSLAYLTKRDSFADQRYAYTIQIDKSKPPIYHAHILSEKDYSDTQDKLILLIRDFKESLFRFYRHQYSVLFQELKPDSLNNPKNFYFKTLKTFESWNPENRLLLFYEDLIGNPKETLKKALSFLNESDELLDEFLKNIETHKKISVDFYFTKPEYGRPVTQGKDPTFHQRKAGVSTCRRLVDLIKSYYPEYTKKYLSRYL